MATINLTSTTGSGFLETDFDQISSLIDGEDTADLAANTAFRTTPSTEITAGTNLTWAGNTLNATGGGVADLQEAFDGGQSITIADTDNQTLSLTNNDNTNDPTTMSITNNTTAGNGLYVTTGTQPYVEATGLAYLRSGNASDTARVLNIVNSGTGHGVDVAQYGAAEGLRINKYAGSGQSGGVLRLVQDDAAADREVIYSRNDGTSYNTWLDNNGTGTALYVDQNGNGIGLNIDNAGTKAGLKVFQTGSPDGDSEFAAAYIVSTAGNSNYNLVSTSASDNINTVINKNGVGGGNALQITNAGTGNGAFIDQNGNGDALNISNSGTADGIEIQQLGLGRALYIAQNTNTTGQFIWKTSTGGGSALAIQNEGTGNGITVDQNGNGVALNIDNAGTNSSLVVDSTEVIDSAGKVQLAAMDATGTPSGTTYLRGDGTWSTPAGGGGTSVPYEQSFTATASQTNFTLTNTPAVAWVWLNGASQDASTWSISGDDIVLSTAATVGDAVEVYYLTGAGIAAANPYAHFTISTNQNIGGSNGTVTYIDWDGTEIHKDTGFTHSTVTNPSRIQVDADGRYQIKATVWGDSTGLGRTMLDVALRIDGTTAHILGAAQNYCRGAAYNDQFGVTMITEVDLTNGQYIEVSSTVNWTDGTYTINTVENRMECIIRKVA